MPSRAWPVETPIERPERLYRYVAVLEVTVGTVRSENGEAAIFAIKDELRDRIGDLIASADLYITEVDPCQAREQ